MKIAEVLPPYPGRLWSLAKQCGVTHAVARLPYDQKGNVSYDFIDLLHMKKRFDDFGLQVEVIEPGIDGQMYKMKLGVDGMDKDLEDCKTLIRNMGALGIPIFCYNFMAQFNWLRTSVSTASRGGAFVTSYDHSLMEKAPLTEAGFVSEEKLWSNLERFLDQILPVAEKAGVRIALHPDDPPVSPIQGVSRIITSVSAMQKVLAMMPSDFSGVTFCQGTLAAAGEDIPSAIRKFGKKIFFVHFRDIRGVSTNFSEVFHDDGQTDMFEAVKVYQEVGFDGPVRIDHVPTMAGENNDMPGYGEMGRLFAIGYLKGLMEGSAGNLQHH